MAANESSSAPPLGPPPVGGGAHQPRRAAGAPPAHLPCPAPEAREDWPTIVGAASVLIASAWLLLVPLGAAAGGINLAEALRPPARPTVPLPAGLGALCGWLTAAQMLLCAVLLAGGVALLRRRPHGPALHLVFAWGSIALSAARFVVVLAAQGGAGQPANTRVQDAFASTAIASVLELAYPCFLLAWLTRAEVGKRTGHRPLRGAETASGAEADA